MGYWTNRTIRGFARGLSAPARSLLSEKNGSGESWVGVLGCFAILALIIVLPLAILFWLPFTFASTKYKNDLMKKSALGRVINTLDKTFNLEYRVKDSAMRIYSLGAFWIVFTGIFVELASFRWLVLPTFGIVLPKTFEFILTVLVIIASSFGIWLFIRRVYLQIHAELINDELEELGYNIQECMALPIDFEPYRVDFSSALNKLKGKRASRR